MQNAECRVQNDGDKSRVATLSLRWGLLKFGGVASGSRMLSAFNFVFAAYLWVETK